jgi:hypothetical protein
VVALCDGGSEARWDVGSLGVYVAWSVGTVLSDGVGMRAETVIADAAVGGSVAGRVRRGYSRGARRLSSRVEGVMVVTARLVLHGRGHGCQGCGDQNGSEGVHFLRVRNERGVYVKNDWKEQAAGDGRGWQKSREVN